MPFAIDINGFSNLSECAFANFLGNKSLNKIYTYTNRSTTT